jgi:hypothetical protein
LAGARKLEVRWCDTDLQATMVALDWENPSDPKSTMAPAIVKAAKANKMCGK